MTHVMIFTYVAAIAIALVAITVQWLAAKKDKKRIYQSGKPFALVLFVLNVYDFVLFYYTHVVLGREVSTLASIGDCMIALLVVLWANMEDDEIGDERFEKISNLSKKYFLIYVVIWILSKLLLPEMYLIRIIIDVPYLILLVILIVRGIVAYRQGRESVDYLAYRSIVTTCLFVNYLIYLESEMGTTLATYNILDFTVFIWIVINVANVIFLYNRDFKHFYMTKEGSLLSAEDAIRNTALKHSLTARESEILKEIYDGKSNTEIAEKLYISESTVKAHVYNLFKKLGTKSRLDAVRIVRDEQKNQDN